MTVSICEVSAHRSSGPVSFLDKSAHRLNTSLIEEARQVAPSPWPHDLGIRETQSVPLLALMPSWLETARRWWDPRPRFEITMRARIMGWDAHVPILDSSSRGGTCTGVPRCAPTDLPRVRRAGSEWSRVACIRGTPFGASNVSAEPTTHSGQRVTVVGSSVSSPAGAQSGAVGPFPCPRSTSRS